VVGKVTGFEEKTVKANRFPGDTGEYRVATVKVQQAVLGAKNLTHVKVGFVLPPPPPKPGPVGGPAIFRKRYPTVNLTKGQEVCLFLKKDGKHNFLVAANYYDVLDKKDPNFAKDLAEVKGYAKLMADPMASLKAKSADDRFKTAAMLISRYRTPMGGNKTELVSAAESKLILVALAGGDWNTMPRPGGRPFNQMNPVMAFGMLGLEPADGWMQPQNFQQFPTAAKEWLMANAGKYRIKRYVAEKGEK
jgi:hypothetical protein